MLAADSRWNEAALLSIFCNALSDVIKDELASSDEVPNLHSLISTAIRLDAWHQGRLGCSHKGGTSYVLSTSPFRTYRAPSINNTPPPLDSYTEEPLQLTAERKRQIQVGECLYCGGTGHFLQNCPLLPKDRALLDWIDFINLTVVTQGANENSAIAQILCTENARIK